MISQLIKGVSRIPQKLLKCFNGAAISTLLLLAAAGVFPVIFTLGMTYSDSAIAALSASLGISL